MSDGLVSLIKADGVCGADVVLFDDTFKSSQSTAPPREEKRIHTHAYYEIFFCKQKSVRIITEAGEEEYGEGAVIIPPSFRHYAVVGAEAYRFFVVASAEANLFKSAAPPGRITFAPVGEDVFFYLKKTFDCLRRGARNEQKLNALVKLVLIDVAESLHSFDRKKEIKNVKPDAEYAFKIEKILSRCVGEKITLSDVAGYLYLSEKQTSRIIMRNYGQPLGKVVADRRLTVAALLLKNTDKSVSDIAAETGFNTECRFFTLFKQKYGITPLAYRKERLHE